MSLQVTATHDRPDRSAPVN